MGNEYSWELDSISHWGVLGMHWGVRRYQNYDGTLTDAGRKRLVRNIQKAYRKEASSPAFSKVRTKNESGKLIGKTASEIYYSKLDKGFSDRKEFKDLKETGDKSKEIFKDYDENSKEYYKGVSGVINAELYSKDATLKDISNSIEGNLYGDLDQGFMSSKSLYLYDTGKLDKAVEVSSEYFKAMDNAQKLGEKLSSEYLDKYGDEPIDYFGKTVNEKVGSRIADIFDGVTGYEYNNNRLIEAADIVNTCKKDSNGKYVLDDSSQYRLKIASKFLAKSGYIDCGWDAWDAAIDDLGYGDIKYDELTQQQLDQIKNAAPMFT